MRAGRANRSRTRDREIGALPLSSAGVFDVLKTGNPDAIMAFECTRPEAASLLDRLIPNACALCNQACDGPACDACWRRHLTDARARCVQCGIALTVGSDRHCGACVQAPPAFDRTLVAVDYAAPVDRLVLGLKYGGRLELAQLCAQAMRPLLQAEADKPALLCPVPLGPQRLAGRGFNQALEIARLLARVLGLRLQARLLERVRETQAQVQLPAQERRRNLRHAFILPPKMAASIAGLHVGVVDDVMTTGATLDEIAATLKRFGAARVSAIVFARTPPH
jgi:ComF family protein